jgi:hypothetical protein
MTMLLAFAGIGYLAYTVRYDPARLARWRGNVRDAADGVFSRLRAGGPGGGGGYRREYGGTDDVAEEPADVDKAEAGAADEEKGSDSSASSSGSSSPAAGMGLGGNYLV